MIKIRKKILLKHSLSFLSKSLIGYLIVFVISSGGCSPHKKTKPPTLIQLEKEKEKEHLLNLLSLRKVKRKDIAFLFIYYLNDLLPFFERKKELYPVPNNRIIDIKGIEEEHYIVDALRMGWMRNFPDGKFYPNDDIKRFQFAMLLYRVSKTLPLSYGKRMKQYKIKDVTNSDYPYKAICFVVTNKLLNLKNGFFFKDRNVTGYEACRALSEFRKMLKK